MLRKIARSALKGASWQNPIIRAGAAALDPLDWVIRAPKGLTHLPPYSVRIRSNGVSGQLGGSKFARLGRLMADYLTDHAGLTHDSRVLEIGCGCGRTAYALLDKVDRRNFTGVDIDRIVVRNCADQRAFKRKAFRFDAINVRNSEYNPHGAYHASRYRFPYDANCFEVIFLVSVFTHMLTKEVERYIAEISRMLTPGGHCMITTFLMGYGEEGHFGIFAHSNEAHHFIDPKMPEIAVGYSLDFFEREFAKHGVELAREPIWGGWRKGTDLGKGAAFGQDVLFFRKAAPT